jgi:hypothetical protein
MCLARALQKQTPNAHAGPGFWFAEAGYWGVVCWLCLARARRRCVLVAYCRSQLRRQGMLKHTAAAGCTRACRHHNQGHTPCHACHFHRGSLHSPSPAPPPRSSRGCRNLLSSRCTQCLALASCHSEKGAVLFHAGAALPPSPGAPLQPPVAVVPGNWGKTSKKDATFNNQI